MAANKLRIDVMGNVLDVKVPILLCNLSMQVYLKQYVAELFAHVLHVELVDGVEKLGRFLDEVLGEALMRLFAIPRTSTGSAEASDSAPKVLKCVHRAYCVAPAAKITRTA